MGSYQREHWAARLDGGARQDDRRSGSFLTYLPDLLMSRPLVVSQALARKAVIAELVVRNACAGAGAGSRSMQGMARFLLRSEAIASSQIEGIAPSPQQVAIAELAQEEDVRGFSQQARLVANNITVLRKASQELVELDAVRVEDIVTLHAALLPEERYQGIRTVQNWIGGSNWHPLDAEFVPPAVAAVPNLMQDLTGYLNGSIHAPLVQAALVHAQFESIHPFVDGNGRVGRALIHTVLSRRGLSPQAVLPVSLVLSTLRDRYVRGLMAFRFDGDPSSPAGAAAAEHWLDVFLDSAIIAAEQAVKIATEITDLHTEWSARVAQHRASVGVRETPRSDSATARILEALTRYP